MDLPDLQLKKFKAYIIDHLFYERNSFFLDSLVIFVSWLKYQKNTVHLSSRYADVAGVARVVVRVSPGVLPGVPGVPGTATAQYSEGSAGETPYL